MQHIEQTLLSNYLTGVLPEQDLRHCERHLLDCDDCRGDLALLLRVLDGNPSTEEMAIIDSVDRVERKSAVPNRALVPSLSLSGRFWRWAAPAWKLAAVSIGVIIVAAATLVFVRDGSENAQHGGATQRTFEARYSGQPYSEFIHTRTGSTEDHPVVGEDELKRLSQNRYEVGRFYLQHDDFGNAVAQLEEAKQKQPFSAEISNDLGVAYLESGAEGALQKALGEFQRALQFNPRYQPALFNMSLAYERLGQFPAAEQELNLYLQVDPDSDWAKEVKSKLQLLKR
jgi:tetratricopeptide (TPR) repeat protein